MGIRHIGNRWAGARAAGAGSAMACPTVRDVAQWIVINISGIDADGKCRWCAILRHRYRERIAFGNNRSAISDGQPCCARHGADGIWATIVSGSNGEAQVFTADGRGRGPVEGRWRGNRAGGAAVGIVGAVPLELIADGVAISIVCQVPASGVDRFAKANGTALTDGAVTSTGASFTASTVTFTLMASRPPSSANADYEAVSAIEIAIGRVADRWRTARATHGRSAVVGPILKIPSQGVIITIGGIEVNSEGGRCAIFRHHHGNRIAFGNNRALLATGSHPVRATVLTDLTAVIAGGNR